MKREGKAFRHIFQYGVGQYKRSNKLQCFTNCLLVGWLWNPPPSLECLQGQGQGPVYKALDYIPDSSFQSSTAFYPWKSVPPPQTPPYFHHCPLSPALSSGWKPQVSNSFPCLKTDSSSPDNSVSFIFFHIRFFLSIFTTITLTVLFRLLFIYWLSILLDPFEKTRLTQYPKWVLCVLQLSVDHTGLSKFVKILRTSWGIYILGSPSLFKLVPLLWMSLLQLYGNHIYPSCLLKVVSIL